MKSIPTFRPELHHKANKDNTYLIFIRITFKRELRRIPSGIYLTKSTDFNKDADFGKWIRMSESNHKNYNEKLVTLIMTYRDKVFEYQKKMINPSIDDIYDLLMHQPTSSFFDFYKSEIVRYKAIGKYDTSLKHQFVLDKIKKYANDRLNKQELTFEELTPKFLKDYQTYMIQTLGNAINTVNTDYKCIRTIYKNAIKDDIAERDKYPFDKFPLHEVSTTKEKLYESEIKKIEELEYEPNSWMWHTKNYFLFAYYCAGIRFKDICLITWDNIIDHKVLKYKMSKNKKQVIIQLPRRAKAILDHYKLLTSGGKYIFPILDGKVEYLDPVILKKEIATNNSMCNYHLKKIAVNAGIKKRISMHVARHSFAYIAYEKTKNLVTVQSLLYHSNLKETQIYLTELGHTNLNSAMKLIFE